MNDKLKALEKRLKETEERLHQETLKRRAAEEDLRQSRQTLKAVLRDMPVIILAIDDDGYLLFFNKEFERVSGYSASEIKNSPQVLDLLLPDSSKEAALEPTSQSEWNFISQNGEEKTIAWSNISGYLPILGWKSWKVGLDITELKQTLARVQTLRGLLPICSNCKKIRDDKGYWNRLEGYIQDHSEAEFTHGICPDCIAELYPDYQDRI